MSAHRIRTAVKKINNAKYITIIIDIANVRRWIGFVRFYNIIPAITMNELDNAEVHRSSKAYTAAVSVHYKFIRLLSLILPIKILY